jgi:hypothetical protein
MCNCLNSEKLKVASATKNCPPRQPSVATPQEGN